MYRTLIIGTSIFALAYLWFYWPKRKCTFDFDPGGRKGEFESHAKRYASLANLLLTLSSASAAFLINFLVTLDPTKPRTQYSYRLEQATPAAITLLGLSAASCIGFMLFQNLFYEEYVHSKFPREGVRPRETYTGARYALNLTFAGAGFVYFLLAYVIVAAWLLTWTSSINGDSLGERLVNISAMAHLFYSFVVIVIVVSAIFVWTFWRDAKGRQWNYTTDTSREMYVDVVKTLITASGIGVALVASASARALDDIAKFSMRAGVVTLIICICASLVTMLALTRGHERARSRNIEAGNSGEEGQLLDFELLLILIPGGVALASFLVGLLFLGRITFHT